MCDKKSMKKSVLIAGRGRYKKKLFQKFTYMKNMYPPSIGIVVAIQSPYRHTMYSESPHGMELYMGITKIFSSDLGCVCPRSNTPQKYAYNSI